MYTASPPRREPLPALQHPRGAEECRSLNSTGGDTRLGKAWSPPVSLNGTLTRQHGQSMQSMQQQQHQPATSCERQFTLSSSPPRSVSAAAGASALADRARIAAPPKSARRVSPLIAHVAPASTHAAAAATAAGETTGDAPATSSQSQRTARIAEIDAFLTRHAAAHTPEPQRNANVRRALEDAARAYAPLSSIAAHVSRYVRELGAAAQSVRAEYVAALAAQEQALYEKFEGFFEKKIAAILSDKAKLERTMRQLHAENFELRQDRDGELTALKADLMQRLNECEKREDEFRSFRQLIAAVYKTNGQLTNRVEQLEQLLLKHRIEVPPASDDLFLYSRSRGDGERSNDSGDSNDVGGAIGAFGCDDPKRQQQRRELMLKSGGKSGAVGPVFMEASRKEMNMARLTLQQELLHCAFDDRSAYRLQISGLRAENSNLQYKVSTLSATVESLNRYIHEKRFLTVTYDDEGNEVRPLTPRPQDVPFGIETELGIDLKGSTAEIVSELFAVATNLKHQLNSALLRLRQATTVSEWMAEETFLELDTARNGEAGVLPTFPIAEWPAIPHFLRTRVSPDVDNMRWSPSDIAAVLYTFFKRYPELCAACRFVRDSKMMAPRTHQQFERREVVLTRLDATKEEIAAADGEINVPFGYVVTHFIRDMLMRMAPASKEARLALPGTLHPRFTVRGEERAVELECTRFAYNIWWAAQRHRTTQPLCCLFLDVVDGRLSPEVFAVTERVVAAALRHVQRHVDLDGSRTLPYPRLVSSVTRLVSDLGPHATRCAVLAVAQTFEENQVPIVGGRVRYDAVAADETHCMPEARLGSEDASNATNGYVVGSGSSRGTAGLPPLVTARRVPSRQQQPLGASVLTRFWRRLVMERYADVYGFVERAMAPLVVESDVVLGLYLLPIPEAIARASAFESDSDARAADFAAPSGALFFPSDSALPLASISPVAAEAYEAAAREAPAVTKSYAALLAHRHGAVQARQTEEWLRLAGLVRDVLETLPRLHRSVHFPFAGTGGGGVNGLGGAGDSSSIAGTSPTAGGAAASAAIGSPTSTRSATPMPAASAPVTTGAEAPVAEGRRMRKPKAAKGSQRSADAASKGAATDNSAAVTTARSAVARRGDGGRPRSRRGGCTVVPEAMVTLPDRELVEWFGFCFALRQRALQFSETIFQQGFLEERRGTATPAAAAAPATATSTVQETAASDDAPIGGAADGGKENTEDEKTVDAAALPDGAAEGALSPQGGSSTGGSGYTGEL